VGDRLGEANVLQAIGDVQQFRDERDAALESYAQALGLFRAVGAKLGEANVLQAIGDVQQFRDERDAALESYAQALGLFRAVGAKLGEANVLAALSRVEIGKGNLAEAEQRLDEVIRVRQAMGDFYSQGADYGNFAVALLQAGQAGKAHQYALKAQEVFHRIGEPSLLRQVQGLIEACERAANPPT
jgi:tetratricopeptide (TPR) repeat protein